MAGPRELLRAFLALGVAIEYGLLGLAVEFTPVRSDGRVVIGDSRVGPLQLLVQGHGGENNLQLARSELARVSSEG